MLDPDILVDVTNAASAPEAEMLALMFQNAGIPAHAMTNAGATNPWELGSSNPFRIAVRRQDLEEARRVLAEYRANRGHDADVDWNTVDVGEPEPGEDHAVTPAPGHKLRHSIVKPVGQGGVWIILAAILGGLAITTGIVLIELFRGR